jgi:hypothetical protein
MADGTPDRMAAPVRYRPQARALELLAKHRVADHLDDYQRESIPDPPYRLVNASAEQTLESIAAAVKNPNDSAGATGVTFFGYRTLVISRREENRRRLRLLMHAARTEADETRRGWVRQFLAERWGITEAPAVELEDRFVLNATKAGIKYNFDLRGDRGGE